MYQLILTSVACMCMACAIRLHQRLYQKPFALFHATCHSIYTRFTARFEQLTPAPLKQPPTPHISASQAPPSADLPTPAQLASAIRARRSIFPKDFTGDIVSHDSIMAMLEAANWAPTHGRTEPWRFVVLGQRGMQDLQLLTEEIFRRRLEGQTDVQQNVLAQLQHDRLNRWKPVSHMIAICMARQPRPEKLMPLWEEIAAVACAVQNMHLMATSLGVGAYWSSWHDLARDSNEMLEFLGMDHTKGDRCWGFFIVGSVQPHVAQGYRATRGPVQSKTVWHE